MVGIAQTLLRVGADSVLSALWEVDSVNATQFMKAFYEQLGLSADYATALRAVKLHYIRQATYRRHPAYWAAFILTGLPDKRNDN